MAGALVLGTDSTHADPRRRLSRVVVSSRWIGTFGSHPADSCAIIFAGHSPARVSHILLLCCSTTSPSIGSPHYTLAVAIALGNLFELTVPTCVMRAPVLCLTRCLPVQARKRATVPRRAGHPSHCPGAARWRRARSPAGC